MSGTKVMAQKKHLTPKSEHAENVLSLPLAPFR